VEFCLLGPLSVRRDDGPVPVPNGRQRILLAALLLRANQVVGLDELAELVWEGSPPASARVTLQNYVKRLRQAFGPAERARIVTRPPGYLLTVAPGELDVTRFSALCTAGLNAARAGAWDRAGPQLNAALSLWRGRPLLDVPGQALAASEAPLLEELRLQALETRIDADMHLGRHDQVAGELQQLVAAEPLRERLHALLMLALYRSGRRAAALEAYRHARRLLLEELGVEPDAELRALHRQILAADPALAAPATTATTAPAAGPVAAELAVRPAVPHQLPRDLADFTGRAAQVGRLSRVLAPAGRDGDDGDDEDVGATPVCLITGPGGIGKTALAVHVAHRLRARFPDGQLFIGLGAAGPRPLAAADVLARFLRDLGTAPSAAPGGEEEYSARFRSALDGKRVLIVLDDADDAAQVRPLLPGSGGSAVLATSRSRLSGLDSCTRLDLGGLAGPDGQTLLARIIGEDRSAAEPGAAATVLDVCAGLPLAIRIAGARLAERPGWSVATLADRLADARGRLDELTSGDHAVRASFQVSYAALPGPAGDAEPAPARAFRLLSLADGPSIGLPAAAALLDCPVQQVEPALEVLLDTNLMESAAPAHYRFHDLLRAYATERAEAEETAAARHDAVRLVLRWYLHTAAAAARMIDPRLHRVDLGPAAAGGEPLAFAGYEQALGWLDAERPNLVAAVRQAARAGEHEIAWKLPVSLWDLFNLRGHWDEWIDTLEIGLASVRELGDQSGEARTLNNLAVAYTRRGRVPDALRCFGRALHIRRERRDLAGQASILQNRGLTLADAGRFDESMANLRAALSILRELGSQDGEAMVIHAIGVNHRAMGHIAAAMECFEWALDRYRAGGHRFGESWALIDLAAGYGLLGESAQAIRFAHRAVELNRQTGYRRGEAQALSVLGQSLLDDSQTEDAQRSLLDACAILHSLGDAREAEIRAQLGELRAQNGGRPGRSRNESATA
jgi:DNA-binding SARP family transcriptional activator